MPKRKARKAKAKDVASSNEAGEAGTSSAEVEGQDAPSSAAPSPSPEKSAGEDAASGEEPEDSDEELEKVDTRPVLRVEERLSWAETGVADWLVKQCQDLGIASPSPVQYSCIPRALGGEDVVGCSRTGTGKTLAFVLPIVQLLSEDPWGVFALVLTPTRELAVQIAEQLRVFGRAVGLKDALVIGGESHVNQATELHRRPHVVVATPGRLAEHISSDPDFRLFNKLRVLVLDEADRLLHPEYGSQLSTILGAAPKKRQTLLFSATMTDALSRLASLDVHKTPYFFEDKSQGEELTVQHLEQRYVLCPVDVKDAYLVHVVVQFARKHPHSSILCFTHTCREAQALAMMFRELGFAAGSLHSEIRQSERLSALAQFRANRLQLLIATDVASRGLDIPSVDLVVNHNVSRIPKEYVHRVGRAARAGREGAALTFVTQYDLGLVKAVEDLIGKELRELKVSGKKVALHVTEVLVAKREAEVKLDSEGFGERKERHKRNKMLLDGMEPEQVDKVLEERRRWRDDRTGKRLKHIDRKLQKDSQKDTDKAQPPSKRIKKRAESWRGGSPFHNMVEEKLRTP